MPFYGKYGPICSTRAKLRFCAIALLAIVVGVTGGGQMALAHPSNNVPLDNWAYEGLDKLAGFGLIHSDVKGMRPYTRMEVARLVSEAIDAAKGENAALPSLISYFLDRFKQEYREELARYGHGTPETSATALKPIVEAQATYVYSKGQPQYFLNTGGVNQYPISRGNDIVGWTGTPLLPNDQGIVYGNGSNYAFQFASSFEFLGLFSGYVEPLFLLRQDGSSGIASGGTPATVGSYGTNDVALLTGYVKYASSHSFEIEIGRDSMWWGQGYTGTLILTDNAPPLDMIKVSNPAPIILPGFLRGLGPFKYSFFFARLEDNRDYSDTLYGGERLDFKPTPNFEMGFSQTFQFGGVGSGSPGTFLNWFELASMLKMGGTNNENENHEAAFDFRYRMPYFQDAELYGEWGGEDTGFKPDNIRTFFLQDIGYQIGLYIPRLTSDARTDLRLEYTDNVNEGGPGTVLNGFWYGHSVYRSGMTYYGFILGDPMGPDARQGFARLTRYIYNDLKVGLDGGYTERGANVGRAIENEFQIGADLTYNINSEITAMMRYAWGDIRNYDLTVGSNQQDNLLMMQVKYEF